MNFAAQRFRKRICQGDVFELHVGFAVEEPCRSECGHVRTVVNVLRIGGNVTRLSPVVKIFHNCVETDYVMTVILRVGCEGPASD